jgi:hypothetical protein
MNHGAAAQPTMLAVADVSFNAYCTCIGLVGHTTGGVRRHCSGWCAGEQQPLMGLEKLTSIIKDHPYPVHGARRLRSESSRTTHPAYRRTVGWSR